MEGRKWGLEQNVQLEHSRLILLYECRVASLKGRADSGLSSQINKGERHCTISRFSVEFTMVDTLTTKTGRAISLFMGLHDEENAQDKVMSSGINIMLV